MELSLSSSSISDSLNLPSNLLHQITASLQITSLLLPIDAVAPPPVRSRRTTTSTTRTLLKRRRRTRRKSPPSDGEDDGVFFGGDDGGGWNIGGFGGGRGWNFGGNGGGGFNWNSDGSSHSFPDDPAFDFVYEVVCWIVFSNCLHFAFKKILRLLTEEREKIPISSVC